MEIITFFSMLDMVTDITYVCTEKFARPLLHGLAVLFCVMPFIALQLYFIVKIYRVVT